MASPYKLGTACNSLVEWIFFYKQKKKKWDLFFGVVFFLKHLIILSYFLDWFSFVFLVWLLFFLGLKGFYLIKGKQLQKGN